MNPPTLINGIKTPRQPIDGRVEIRNLLVLLLDALQQQAKRGGCASNHCTC